MNIYLDIDGVLIDDSLKNRGAPTSYVIEFLRYITENYTCFWLTTHCSNGENHVLEYLSSKLPIEAHEYIIKIKPTDWKEWKTEAIDFSKDFRWIDDEIYDPEIDMLDKNNCKEKLILVNLRKNPEFLKNILIS